MNALEEFQSRDFLRDYRARVLFSMVPRGQSLFDLGSGNGVIAEFLKGRFNKIVLTDNSQILVDQLQEKFKDRFDVEVRLADANILEPVGLFDVITACDILEHIEGGALCLDRCRVMLAPRGSMFISVPAFPLLYGLRDKKYGHLRRYRKRELRRLLEDAGFQIDTIYYWNFIGFFPYLISEKIFKKSLIAPARSYKKKSIVKNAINTILYFLLRIESHIPLPFGLTLIVIAKKRK
ncbi:MAG: class I SAM-dependent methyltransferase [Patescibacteria group bacterium]